ncbi:MAG: hypothetical protein R3A13_04660 [Bdellovibrionota bacterium]
MAKASWLAFCVSSPVTKTFVHFFPSSGGLTAPYNAECTLTLFGSDLGKKTVKIDGLKITQPDGIRIDDAFPHFEKSEVNVAGLRIDLNTKQPRVDLNNSWCVVELVSQAGSTKFRAKNLSQLGSQGSSAGALLSDEQFSSSLIAVNADKETFTPTLLAIDHEKSLNQQKSEETESHRKNINISQLAPLSVEEISVNGDFFTESTHKDFSWGRGSLGGVYLDPSTQQEAAVFAIYRDTKNKRPISVIAL